MDGRKVFVGVGLVLLMGGGVVVWWRAYRQGNSEGAGSSQNSAKQVVSATTAGTAELPSKPPSDAPSNPAKDRLKQLLPHWEDSKLAWLADNYGWTAVNIVKEHKDWGAEVLTALGYEGVAVMREHPDTFQQLAKRLGGKTAARLLVILHQHLKTLASQGGLPEFLDRLEALPEKTKQLAEKYPLAIPFLVQSPHRTEQALRLYPELCLRCFTPVDLSQGPQQIEKISQFLLDIGERAKRWIEYRGLDGLLLGVQFSEWLDRTPPMDLPIFLEAVSKNQADLRTLKESGKLQQAWEALCLVAEKARQCPQTTDTPVLTRDTWLQLLTCDEHAVRFIVEYDPACQLLEQWIVLWVDGEGGGPPLPSLIIDGYHADRFPQKAQHALEAVRRANLAGQTKLAHTLQMLTLMARYGENSPHPPPEEFRKLYHPNSYQFHDLLLRLDHRVVFYCMEKQQNLPAALQRLQERGLDELQAYERPPSQAIQRIPGYDAYQLGWVLFKGYTPTWGEVIFGAWDVAFTTADMVGILKTVFKGAGQKAAKEVAEQFAKSVSKDLEKQAGKEMAEKARQWAAWGAWKLLKSSPKVLRRSLKIADQLGWWAHCAERSADNFNLSIKISAETAKIFVREWAIGAASAQGLEEVAKSASQNPATQVLAEKILQCLQWLEQPVAKP